MRVPSAEGMSAAEMYAKQLSKPIESNWYSVLVKVAPITVTSSLDLFRYDETYLTDVCRYIKLLFGLQK